MRDRTTRNFRKRVVVYRGSYRSEVQPRGLKLGGASNRKRSRVEGDKRIERSRNPIRAIPCRERRSRWLRCARTNGTSLSESLYSFWVYGDILGHDVKVRTTEQGLIRQK